MSETTPSGYSAEVQDMVYSLATSPVFARDGLCFAARPAGLYRSDDGGLTWQSAYASLELQKPLTTVAVIFSPDFERDHSLFAGVRGGVLRSVDGGRHWYVSSFDPPPFVSALVVSPNFAQDGTLLAGTLEDGVLRSGDRGEHWTAWNFGLLDLNVLCLAISPSFAGDETLFAGTESGIFRSTNGGRAWREVEFPMEYAPVLSLALSPGYATDGLLLAGSETNGLFISRDRGATWERLGQKALGKEVSSIALAPRFPDQPDILVVSDNAVLISRDGGATWADWPEAASFSGEVVAVAAPQGLEPGALLLVGLTDGRVVRVAHSE